MLGSDCTILSWKSQAKVSVLQFVRINIGFRMHLEAQIDRVSCSYFLLRPFVRKKEMWSDMQQRSSDGTHKLKRVPVALINNFYVQRQHGCDPGSLWTLLPNQLCVSGRS